jgi:hypothetical protein
LDSPQTVLLFVQTKRLGDTSTDVVEEWQDTAHATGG